MNNRLSVRFYLAISHALFVLAVLGGGSLIWYSRQEQVAEHAIREQLVERARLLATAGDIEHPLTQELDLPIQYTAIESNLAIVFITPQGVLRDLSDRPLTADQKDYVLDISQEALSGAAISREIYGETPEEETLYAAAPVYNSTGGVIGAVCLLLTLRDFEETLAQTRSGLIVFSVGMSLFSLILGLILATFMTRSLSDAERLAARVANGDFGVRIPMQGPRELAELSGYLNKMADELEDQTRKREIVLSNLTHELARPLGGLRLGIESLLQGAMSDPELASDLLNEMNRTVDRIETLLDDLSMAAHPVREPVSLVLKPMAIEPLLQGVKARFRSRAAVGGVRLDVDLAQDLPAVQADELRLAQILGNLLDNAIKFTPPGGWVKLSAQPVAGGVRLTVRDTGPGIPAEEMEAVKEPFYQSRKTTAVYKGLGLGLAIANQLALAHHGKLELENLPEGGLAAHLTIPIAENQ